MGLLLVDFPDCCCPCLPGCHFIQGWCQGGAPDVGGQDGSSSQAGRLAAHRCRSGPGHICGCGHCSQRQVCQQVCCGARFSNINNTWQAVCMHVRISICRDLSTAFSRQHAIHLPAQPKASRVWGPDGHLLHDSHAMPRSNTSQNKGIQWCKFVTPINMTVLCCSEMPPAPLYAVALCLCYVAADFAAKVGGPHRCP